ncbi:phage tail protein I [Desulfobulbus elongatus]|uniref:phage tail protein I n=1 Tax=Desulfobulbus elongatus TaxID=53332 RepID=UPI0004816107|nr:phage tail protein I [Desulfobulbus elongatus]
MSSLLPPSATAQERALAETIARISDVPVLVRESWNPDTCPAALLPWLAWAFSVDEWQSEWSEASKRAVIKTALYVHKKKGTLSALKRAVEPLGYIIRIVEWYEEDPPGVPYTFRLEVGVLDKGINETIYQQLERIIQCYKNVRSYMQALTIKGEVRGALRLAAAMTSGVDTTVYPWSASAVESVGGMYWGAAEQSVDIVAVYPDF